MWADPDADYEKIGALQAELEDKIAATDAWSLERNVEIAMDALRCPPNDADVTTLSGGERRRVALCRLLLSAPDLLLLDEPTNHLDAESVDWLERFLQDYAGTVVAITHDRYFLDNVARWILELDRGKGFPFEGNYSGWLEQKQDRLAHEEKRRRPASARSSASSSGCGWRPKARQAKGRARLTAYEKLQAEAEADGGRDGRLEIVHPSRAPAGRHGDRGRPPVQGLRRPAAHRGPLLQPAQGRHRRRDRSERRRQDHAVPDAHGRGAARRRVDQGRRDGRAGLRRPEPRHPRRRQHGVRGDHRRAGHLQGRQPGDPRSGLRRPASTSRAPTSRSGSAT